MNTELNITNQKIVKATTKMEIFQYGFGGITVNISYGVITSFLLFFWTNSALVPAAAAGTILFIGRLAGVITDPLAGIISDNTNTRWGKYRPYLIFITPVFMLLFYLLFTNYDMATTPKVIFYGILYFLYMAFSAVVTVNYESLVPIMSTDLKQRNYVVMSRQLFGIFSMVLVVALTNPMVKAFGNNLMAWHKTILIFIVVSILAMMISLRGSKRHDVCSHGGNEGIKKVDFIGQLKMVLTCKPVLLLLIPFGLIILASEVATASSMYLFKYAIKNVDLFSITNIVSLPAILLASISVPMLVGKFGKKRIFIIACLMSMIRPLIFLIIQPFNSSALLIGLYAFAAYFQVVAVVTIWTMVPDCVEYILLKEGLKNSGTVTSSFTFMLDVGGAIAGVLVGGILGLAGYVAVEVQPHAVVQTIIGINSVIPMIAFIIAIVIVKFYPITNKLLEDLKVNQ